MRHKKLENIVPYYGKSVDDLFRDWYVNKKISTQQMAQKIVRDTGAPVTAHGAPYVLNRLRICRSRSDAREVVILAGRVTYEPLRKLIKSDELRKGTSSKIRCEILKRDNFRCVLCGQDAKTTKLAIDHIIPVTRGAASDILNLRSVCGACNHGTMIYENEK